MASVNTPKFRVAFPNVFRPKKNDLNGKQEYSIVALFAKGEDLSGLKKAATQALEKKFGKDPKAWPKNLRTPFRPQEDREKEGENGERIMPKGYVRGAIYLNLRSEERPGVVDHNVESIIDSSDFYGGCYAIASLHAYAYDTRGNKGVSFGLGNIQKVGDGEHFGSRTRPEQDFKAVETENDNSESSNVDMFS